MSDGIDLAHVTGSCAGCKQTGLSAADFVEVHLRNFLRAKQSTRVKDVREEVHATTKKVEVAGAGLFCRTCVESQGAAAAAADGVWNDDEGDGAAHVDTELNGQHGQHQQEGEVPDSWEDD